MSQLINKNQIEKHLGIIPYEVQEKAVFELLNRNIIQMETGEGKSLVSILTALNLYKKENKKVFIFTTNEYLAERDMLLFTNLMKENNIKLGLIKDTMSHLEKEENYKLDIIYTTATNVAFDYLRGTTLQVGTPLITLSDIKDSLVILDEIDSILLDKGNTPLIISESINLSTNCFMVDKLVKSLKEFEHYNINKNNIYLTQQGLQKLNKNLSIEALYAKGNEEYAKLVHNALKANYLLKKNVEYIVEKGTIKLVDQSTGRKLESQSYSDGLQQAIEVKEGLDITHINQTKTMITLQNFISLFDDFVGLSGTAKPAEKEFFKLYNKKVIKIDRNKPLNRTDVTYGYMKKEHKYQHAIGLIKEYHSKKHPILIGTQTIKELNEFKSYLNKENIKFKTLDATKEEEEAFIISKAGEEGSILLSTNMAGRGTDIILSNKEKGLVVIGLSASQSIRIDDQLRGRSGRQGEIGYSFILKSFEDDFYKEKIDQDTLNQVIYLIEKSHGNTKNKDLYCYISYEDKTLLKQLEKFQISYESSLSEQRFNTYEKYKEVEKLRQSLFSRRLEYLKAININNLSNESTKLDYLKLSDSTGNYYNDIFTPKMNEHNINIKPLEQAISYDIESSLHICQLELIKIDNFWKNFLIFFANEIFTIDLLQYSGANPKIELINKVIDYYKNNEELLKSKVETKNGGANE